MGESLSLACRRIQASETVPPDTVRADPSVPALFRTGRNPDPSVGLCRSAHPELDPARERAADRRGRGEGRGQALSALIAGVSAPISPPARHTRTHGHPLDVPGALVFPPAARGFSSASSVPGRLCHSRRRLAVSPCVHVGGEGGRRGPSSVGGAGWSERGGREVCAVGGGSRVRACGMELARSLRGLASSLGGGSMGRRRRVLRSGGGEVGTRRGYWFLLVPRGQPGQPGPARFRLGRRGRRAQPETFRDPGGGRGGERGRGRKVLQGR